eukprot:TRINITY_DN48952_c0_g1_i1.p1 TRINITY_DN48952_c0_g1~~TRINITY_DN48952_c0_g1_i1.p1  ORF type:complete len:112 (+),score=32.36 TRINITY_DN48952_c0_g1_i1:138-473(+)
MIRRPPRSPLSSSSAASDVYKRQGIDDGRTFQGVAASWGGHRAAQRSCLDQKAANPTHVPVPRCPKGPPRLTPLSHQQQQYYIYSVSYTHLRAHETPEHLVCRLLLEKKKT